VAGMPIVVVRDRTGVLRAFYNVCKHRAHELLAGSGTTRNIVCPYHGWTYDLGGGLQGARRADRMATFDKSAICLAAEIDFWAPDVAALTHARRLTYDARTNWKNVIDNFLECYHCHIAHREFVDLVDMGTYEVRTHGVWSSHFAEAGKHENAAYDVSAATVNQHAVWWLWPNTCLLRHPGRANFMVFQVLPAGPERTLETWDFYFETPELEAAEVESVRYIDDVLQRQDIDLVESVQRGMRTPAFDQGRIVYDPAGSGLSEHEAGAAIIHPHARDPRTGRSVLAAGRHQMPFATQAAMLGGNLRVGMEDSLYIGPGELAATNAGQVRKIRGIVEALGHELATPAQARERLALKGADHVTF
jgi:choline monooxygenase